MKNSWLRRVAVVSSAGLVAGLLSVVGVVVSAVPVGAAVDGGCTALGGTDGAGTCVVSAPVAVSGTISVGENLELQSGAHLDATASVSGVTLNVTGDMTMRSGSVLEGDDESGQPDPTGGRPITLGVSGNLVMEAGSRISSDNNVASGTGGEILITVAGDMSMLGTAGSGQCRSSDSLGDGLDFYNYLSFGTPDVYVTSSLGARISAHRFGASNSNSGGHVSVTVGNYGVPPSGMLTIERCSLIDVSSRGSGGVIEVTAGKSADIAGLVLSESGLSGTGATQAPGGGPINVRAGCSLHVWDTGMISSKGQDPGADLVHLKGCDVLIEGIVQSTTSAGHALPNSPANHCNQDTTAHPPGSASGFTACVRILGQNVKVDATGSHNGNVNVDGVRAPMRGWIDIFSTLDTTLLGDPVGVGVKWAVSADACAVGPCSNSFGGVITIKAIGGKVHTENQAILQANATAGGADGGLLRIQAGGSGSGTPALPNASSNVELDSSFLEANGPTTSNTAGGVIAIKSFNGSITSGGSTTGHIQALGGLSPGTGSITLEECSAVDSYLGTVSANTIIENRSVCGGNPVVPADAQKLFDDNAPIWSSCRFKPPTKSGMKFNDLNNNHQKDVGEPGLANWVIDLLDANDNNALVQQTLTNGTGNYTFTIAAPGTYLACEESQAGWTQTYPTLATIPPAGETITNACPGGLIGYQLTVTSGEAFTDNDFGNFKPPPQCPEDPNRAGLMTRTVDTGKLAGGGSGVAGDPTNYLTLQAAYDAAKVSLNTKAEVIGMFSKTTENVLLDSYTAKSMTITQCASAQLTAADGTKPVWDITANKKLLIIGPDSVGGTIGWYLETGGHELKAIRSNGASVAGLRTKSGANSNIISFNNVASSGIGIDLLSNSNALKSGTIGPNSGAGVHIGSGNTGNNVSGMTIQNNGNNGVFVEGNSNTIASNKLNTNSPNGIRVTGSTNTISANQSDTNGAAGFSIAGTGNVVKDNKANKNSQVGFDLFGTGQKLTGSASSTNTLYDFRISALSAVSSPSGNKADGSSIPSASKCTGFFTNAAVLTCT
jgi:hypothetical protein